MTRLRSAFTLVELLVVMALMAVLATLTIAFFPGAATSAREARAATLVQGWLNIAKQTALRDQTPTGIRLLMNPTALTQVIECQYIAQPDDFSTGQIFHAPVALIQNANVAGNVVTINTMPATPHGLSVGQAVGISGVSVAGYNGSYVVSAVPSTTTFQYVSAAPGLAPGFGGSIFALNVASIDFGATTADLTNGFGVLPATNAPFWAVQPGDYLEVNGTGLVHRIENVLSGNQMIVKPALPNPIAQTGKTYYRIIRAPRVVGDSTLKLPDNTFIDIGTNATYANPLPTNATGDIDILFGPSGQVISRGVASDKIHLWVRVPNTDTPGDAFKGDPTLVSIFVRTGFVGAYPPDKSTADPYFLVK